MRNERGKADRPVVAKKSPNKAGRPAAEEMEGRGLAKGNPLEQNASRTPSRSDAPEMLRAAYFGLKKDAAAGVDGETWRHYGEALEAFPIG